MPQGNILLDLLKDYSVGLTTLILRKDILSSNFCLIVAIIT